MVIFLLSLQQRMLRSSASQPADAARHVSTLVSAAEPLSYFLSAGSNSMNICRTLYTSFSRPEFIFVLHWGIYRTARYTVKCRVVFVCRHAAPVPAVSACALPTGSVSECRRAECRTVKLTYYGPMPNVVGCCYMPNEPNAVKDQCKRFILYVNALLHFLSYVISCYSLLY